MSRKGPAIRREMTPDPVYRSLLITQLVNKVMLHGKKSTAIRWIVENARSRREKTMAECLSAELMDASNGLGASMKKRDDMQKMAESNKAFAHYRW